MLILLGDPLLLLDDLESLRLERQVVAILEICTDGAANSTSPQRSALSPSRRRSM